MPWDDFASALEDEGGPLSRQGPLGHRGPLNPDTWSGFEAGWDAAHPGSIAAVHLRPGGMFSVLGQTGPLSALGPLGPLGPIGAHGFARDDAGDYLPEGEACSNAPQDAVEPPCRSLELDYDGETTRRYDLVELYDEAHARALPDNDTSFIVQGEMMPGDSADRFEFTSHSDQWVTMLVVPEYAKYPPFQAVLDVPDMTAGGFCRAPTDGGQASCGPGAIAFQLQSHTCLDNFATELTAVLAEITEALSDADSFEDMVEGFRRFGSSTFEVFSRCSPRLPETVYVRHALEPWSTEVAAARFNPFICHAGTFFLNPFCRATGLNEIYAVDYDHQSSFDDFDLTIDVDFAQTRGQLVSNSGEVIDWVTVKVPAGAKFGANVDLAGIWEVTEQDEEWGLDLFIESAQWADTFSASDVEFMGSGSRTRPVPRYRLIVVGSTDQTQASDVAFGGSYLREL